MILIAFFMLPLVQSNACYRNENLAQTRKRELKG
jgi:hypothetical protein